MIPKIIHYCWFGNNKKTYSVKKCIDSWKKQCPDYEIIEWNEKNFDVMSNKFVKKAYEDKMWAFVTDYARLKIIYENGGIYLDTDVELLKPLDSLLDCGCYLATQQLGGYIATGLGFGAQRGNFIIEKMLDEYDNLEFNYDKRFELICPILNTNVLNRLGLVYKRDEIIEYSKYGLKIYPPKYFDPIANGDSEDLLCKDSVSIHHYSASWTTSGRKWRRIICNILGQQNINKIKKVIKRRK